MNALADDRLPFHQNAQNFSIVPLMSGEGQKPEHEDRTGLVAIDQNISGVEESPRLPAGEVRLNRFYDRIPMRCVPAGSVSMPFWPHLSLIAGHLGVCNLGAEVVYGSILLVVHVSLFIPIGAPGVEIPPTRGE